jgi:tetratricopeptide (TPR) repeat protein
VVRPDGARATGSRQLGAGEDATSNVVVGDVHGSAIQARDIHGGVHHHVYGDPPPPIIPHQLPTDTPHFVGRQVELDVLSEALGPSPGPPVAKVAVIEGTAGAGKTALVVHWAHSVAEEFVDGQLYLNLRGFDPSDQPVSPSVAIRGFLHALGVHPERQPIDFDTQTALFRSLLAPRKILLVLDNARSEGQVRPLLPGSGACRVVVTSRNRLSGLVSGAARVVEVGTLNEVDCLQLLQQGLGSQRTEAEREAVEEIIGRCSRLPLALTIVAARATLRPRFSLRTLADELRDEQVRLDALDTGDPATSVRSVFSWSYRALSPAAAHLFRLVAIAPGSDIGTNSAANLAGSSTPAARAALTELTHANLIEEHFPGRFRCHDLLRAYARELAVAEDKAAERESALRRLLDVLLHTAFVADRKLYPHRDPAPLAATIPGEALGFASYEAAMDWFMVEHANLIAATEFAAANGLTAHAWQLAWSLSTFLDRKGHWFDYADTQRIAVSSAQQLEDAGIEALTRRLLATACTRLGLYEEAEHHLRLALQSFERRGDVAGEARCHLNLGLLYERQGLFREASANARLALGLYRTAGHDVGVARVLSWLGWYRARDGRYGQGLVLCREALRLLRDLGNRWEEGHALHHLGFVQTGLGDLAAAVQLYEAAAALFAELGDPYHEALVLADLGEPYRLQGSTDDARRVWQRALHALESLDHPDAGRLRAALSSLEPASDDATAP